VGSLDSAESLAKVGTVVFRAYQAIRDIAEVEYQATQALAEVAGVGSVAFQAGVALAERDKVALAVSQAHQAKVAIQALAGCQAKAVTVDFRAVGIVASAAVAEVVFQASQAEAGVVSVGIVVFLE
jgi:hypothetical protein